MGQQGYGAAQGIVDIFRRPYEAGRRALGYIPDSLPGLGGGRKPDTSWHDSMVRQSNAMAAANAAAEAAAAKKPVRRTPKRAPTRLVARAAAQKRR